MADAPARTADVLGAVALALTDRLSEAVGMPMSDAAALSALRHVLGSPSIQVLGEVVGISHSGAVRLVDRLAAAGHVTRAPGPDGRTTAVTLTAAGTAAATAVSAARRAVLDAALAGLRPEDLTILDRILGELAVGMMRGPGATRWICRLCDTGACGRYRGSCPIGRELQRRSDRQGSGERRGHREDQP